MTGRSRPRVQVLALFLVSQLLVFIVLVEVGARLIDPLGISYFPETARLLDTMIIEEPIGYRLAPGLEGRFHGVEVVVNELGMRDRPVASPKPEGEKRILLLGDSVMFSVGVEIEDSIPWQLEAFANANAPAGTRYRTLNMGVPSYNTEQELIQLRELALDLEPDVATLLFVINDLEDKMWVFDKRASWLADFAQRSYAVSLFYKLVLPRAKWAVDLVVPEPAASHNGGPMRGAPIDTPRHERVLENLEQIHQVLEANGIPFLLMVHFNVSDPFYSRIQALGAEAGFPVARLDVWKDPRWQGEERRDYRNSATDSHCNPRGCEIHARLMYELMLDAGLLTSRAPSPDDLARAEPSRRER